MSADFSPLSMLNDIDRLSSFELARVLVCFDDAFIVNAMILTRLRRRKRKKERELLGRARYETSCYL